MLPPRAVFQIVFMPSIGMTRDVWIAPVAPVVTAEGRYRTVPRELHLPARISIR